MNRHRIFTTPFSDVYPLYTRKAERKNRSQAEVDRIIHCLTGYDQLSLEQPKRLSTDFEAFFEQAPASHPNKRLIKGLICGLQVKAIENPLMQNIRFWTN